MTTIFALLVLFQVKHFVADYILQTQFMLRKGSPDSKVWVPSLSAHAAVHGFLTFYIALMALWFAGGHFDWYLAARLGTLDFFMHGTIDRIKANPKWLGRFTPANKGFWVSLGGDQMAHHLTHYFFIWVLIAKLGGF